MGPPVARRTDPPHSFVPCSSSPVSLLKPVKFFCFSTPGRRWSTRWWDFEPNDRSARRRIWPFYGNVTENHGNKYLVPLPFFSINTRRLEAACPGRTSFVRPVPFLHFRGCTRLNLACRHILFGPRSVFENFEFVANIKRILISGFS